MFSSPDLADRTLLGKVLNYRAAIKLWFAIIEELRKFMMIISEISTDFHRFLLIEAVFFRFSFIFLNSIGRDC